MTRHRAAAAAAAVALTACARPGPDPSRAFASPGRLTATLVDAATVELRWSRRATADGGTWIELATPGDDFVKVEAVAPEVTSFRDAQLAPGTTFLFRLAPFFGRPSPVVAVTTGPAPRDPPSEAEGPLDPAPAQPSAAPAVSIRSLATFAAAAPAELTAARSSPTSVELRWSDHASDEDGYLVEVGGDPRDLAIAALLPPDTTSFRKIELPAESIVYLRVRAFFDGAPSPAVSIATPPEAVVTASDRAAAPRRPAPAGPR